MEKKKIQLRPIVVSSIMGALGAVFMFIEFSVPIMPEFIKFDISELPALLTSFACGPWYGVLVCLIKNLLHLFVTKTMGIGELSNFLLGAVFAFLAGYIYKAKKTRKVALIASLVASFVRAAFGRFAYNFLIYPMFMQVLGMPEEVFLCMYQNIIPSVESLLAAISIFNVPFTFVKGLIVSIICFIIYKRLSPILKGKKI